MLFKLAVRNVLRQRRRSILTCLSIAGGYLMCAVSFSLVEGSYSNVIRIFTEDETGHVQLHKDNYLREPKLYLTIDDMAGVEKTLNGMSEVQAFAPRVYAPALAYGDDGHAPARVIGFDPVKEAATSRLRQKLTRGTWPDGTRNQDGIAGSMIGDSVARSLDLELGDELILISQGADGSVANDLFIVSGIIGDRRSAERQNVYLPLGVAQEFLALQGRVHEYAILLHDIDEARVIAEGLGERLPALSAAPWQVARETFYRAMEADKTGNQFTLAIILFIVFIGVLNTVLMSVLERTREFGVLKAIGSRPGLIARLIMLETTILATASLVIGIVLALPLIAWFTYVGIELPEPIDMGGVQFSFFTGAITPGVILEPVAIIFVYAIGVSLLPGLRAARVLPTEAMRSY